MGGEGAGTFEADLGPAEQGERTILPIMAEKGRELPYLLRAEALAGGILAIGERGEQVLFVPKPTGIPKRPIRPLRV